MVYCVVCGPPTLADYSSPYDLCGHCWGTWLNSTDVQALEVYLQKLADRAEGKLDIYQDLSIVNSDDV